jgi:ribosomal protein S27AE
MLTVPTIIYAHDASGNFIAVDTANKVSCYAYCTSEHAESAKKNPARVAAEMLQSERELFKTLPMPDYYWGRYQDHLATVSKTAGQLAYEEDVRRHPKHDDGRKRPTWEGLAAIYSPSAVAAIHNSWERNPSQRFADVCIDCDNSPCICEIDSSEQDEHRTGPTLYQVEGDLYTTKAPECPYCGFTVRKDGTCGFCE